VYRGATLCQVLVLPATTDAAELKSWMRIVKAWNRA